MQLQKFGLEIRKIGSLQNLYKDVDNVLANYKIPPNSINTGVQSLTVAHSLQKMMNVDSHISVCTIKDCAILCGLVIPKERMLVYSAVHCMHWNEMTPEYRQVITSMILDDFRSILDPGV